MERICNNCKVIKDIKHFQRDSGIISGYKVTCKSCRNARRKKSRSYTTTKMYAKEYYIRNKLRILAIQKAKRKGEDISLYMRITDKSVRSRDQDYTNRKGLKRHKERRWKAQGINLTYSEFENMLLCQNNKCYLCGNLPEKDRSLSVDHNHKTGKIRKLLCFNCNTSIGKLGDDILGITRALNYLKEHE